MIKYRFLKHTADVKFRAYGTSIEEVFENSALALKKTIVNELKIREILRKKINVSGRDIESLLYAFLEEFLFLLDSDNFLFSEIKSIKIKNNKLSAEIWGDKASSYQFSNNVKAITYNEMFVKFDKKKKEWIVQIVLDV
jgi:SHS2 domain-containing protein